MKSSINRRKIKQIKIFSQEKSIEFLNFLNWNSIKCNDISLLESAFIHKSFTNEEKNIETDNERLEYLGDSVLQLVTNEYLYAVFPNYNEGKLSKIKSKVVSEASLSKISREKELNRFLLLGKGEKDTGGLNRDSNLANLLEALLGAIYLDSGLDSAKNFILPSLKKMIHQENDKQSYRDYKTTLQEYCQKKYQELPIYTITSEVGPDHQKNFEIMVQIKNRSVSGIGSSKRKAEQDAARNLLKLLKIL